MKSECYKNEIIGFYNVVYKIYIKKIYGGVSMRKTSLFVTMLIIFNLLLMTSSARASNLTNANYILNANTQIKEYVNALNNSLVDEATQKKMYDFFADSNSNLANYIASRHSIYAEWAKNNNAKFTNISVNVNIDNMKYDNGKIFANLYTTTTVTYEYLSGKGAGIPNTFKFSEAHDLVLENKNGIYKIIKDNFYDSLRPDLSEDHVNMKVFDYNIDNNDNNTDSNALMNQNSIIPDSCSCSICR